MAPTMMPAMAPPEREELLPDLVEADVALPEAEPAQPLQSAPVLADLQDEFDIVLPMAAFLLMKYPAGRCAL